MRIVLIIAFVGFVLTAVVVNGTSPPHSPTKAAGSHSPTKAVGSPSHSPGKTATKGGSRTNSPSQAHAPTLPAVDKHEAQKHTSHPSAHASPNSAPHPSAASVTHPASPIAHSANPIPAAGHYTKVYLEDITEPGIQISCSPEKFTFTEVLLTTVKPRESEKAHLLIDKSLFDNLWCLETQYLLQEIDKYIVFKTTSFSKVLFNECLNDADKALFEQHDGDEMSFKELFDNYKDNAQMYSLIGKLLFCKRKETDYLLLKGNSYFFITKDSATSLNGIFDKYKDDAHMHSFVCKMLFDKYKDEKVLKFQSFNGLEDGTVMTFMLKKNQKELGKTTVEKLKKEDEIHLP